MFSNAHVNEAKVQARHADVGTSADVDGHDIDCSQLRCSDVAVDFMPIKFMPI